MAQNSDSRLDKILSSLLRPSGVVESQSAIDSRHVTPMVVSLDPATRKILEIKTDAHDTPQSMEIVRQLLKDEREHEIANPSFNGLVPPPIELPSVAPSTTHGAFKPSAKWLGQVVDENLQQLRNRQRIDRGRGAIVATVIAL